MRRAPQPGNGRCTAKRIGPGDDFKSAVFMLGQCGTAFHPIAAIHVADTMLVANGGVVDVAADHAIGAVTPSFARQRSFEGADIVHGILDLQLRPLRERPIGHAERAAEKIHQSIHLDCEVVGPVAEMGKPARVLHHEIEDVAMDDEVTLAIDAGVNGVFHNIDTAEMGAVIIAQELVVIARHVNHLGALARLAQHFLHEIVVRLRPVPAGFQRPAIDDVSDQINGIGIMATEEIEQSIGLRAAGSEMDVGDKQCAIAPFGALFT